MKRYIFTIVFILSFKMNYSQNLSYGPLLGLNVYNIEVEGPIGATGGLSKFNFGGYIDYKLSNHFGVKSNLIYSKAIEKDYYVGNGSLGANYFIENAEVQTLQLQGLLKYDVRNDYSKGFYFVSGLRVSHLLKAEENSENIDDFYKKNNFGLLLGFGVNFAKHIGIEILPEYYISDTIESKENKSKNYGVYANLLINLESIINK